MSEFRPLLVLLLLLAVVAPVGAQRAEGSATAVARSARLDSLLVELSAAGTASRHEDSLRWSRERAMWRGPLDSARVGPLLLIAPPGELPRARRAFAAGWRRLRSLLGTARLPETAFLVARRDPPPNFGELADRPRHYGIWLAPRDGGVVERSAERAIGGALANALSPELVAWLKSAPLSGTDAAASFRELATSPAQAARGCLAGEVADCAAALALDPAGPDWSRWYTPAQLRQVVAVQTRGWPNPLAVACARGADDACRAHLSEYPPPPPISAKARANFVTHLLQTRGPGAFATLQNARGDVRAQLSALSADGSLMPELGAWRQHVLASRRQAQAGLPVAAALTFLWVAIFFALALRSTRWRLG